MHGANKTRITYRVNLNFVRARRYINFLEAKELIAKINGNPGTYQTTEKGKEYLKNYQKLLKTLK